jgi:hypothetical protein
MTRLYLTRLHSPDLIGLIEQVHYTTSAIANLLHLGIDRYQGISCA